MTRGESFLLDLIARGLLEVREDGTLWRRFARSRTGVLRRLDPIRADRRAAKGYRAVCIQWDGVHHRAMAHRLIWMAANGPLSDEIEVNHKNGVRDANWLGNLEPLTHGQNQSHSYRELGRPRAQGLRNGSARLSEDDVRRILAMKGHGTQKAIGARFGVSKFAVYRIWNGIGWTHLANGMPEVRP